MTVRRIVSALMLLLVFAATVYPFQNRWAKYEREMQDPIDDPPDARDVTEFAFGRLRYRSPRDGFRGRARWGTDANKGDRLFMQALKRLSRLNIRSIEEVLDVDSDEMFNFPFMYAVGVGDWTFNPEQAERMRNFFERGGFLMVDDFHNDGEWEDFMVGVRMMFPNPQVVDIPNDDAIFHTVFDLSQRVQISGLNIVYGSPYERGGYEPHWRAILDEKGRIVIAACHNMDVGDAWEWADYPPYPEKLSSLAFRLGLNYAIYSMTH